MKNLVIKNLPELSKFAKLLSGFLKAGDMLLLSGELGAGKTTLVTKLAKEFKVKEQVSSPTFTLVNKYVGKEIINHIDLYRLNSKEELFSLDIIAYLEDKKAINIIEWAEKLQDLKPLEFLEIDLKFKDRNSRELCFEAKGKNYQNIVKKIRQKFSTND
jgi:tRNA threonylcarbamoyladenosine biosynthesis protein TsaE